VVYTKTSSDPNRAKHFYRKQCNYSVKFAIIEMAGDENDDL